MKLKHFPFYSLFFAACLSISIGSIAQSCIRVESLAPSHILGAFLYPVVLSVIFSVFLGIFGHFQDAIDQSAFGKINFLLLFSGLAGGVIEGFSRVAGYQGWIFKIIFLIVLIAAIFQLTKRAWFPSGAALIPGLIIGVGVVFATESLLNLIAYENAPDRIRFAVFSIINLGAIGTGVAFAGLFTPPKKYDFAVSSVFFLATCILVYVNRIYLLSVPIHYLHLVLAFFEWVGLIGFIFWSRWIFRWRKAATLIFVFTLLSSLLCLLWVPRNRLSPIPRRLESSSEFFVLPWMIFDLDGDHFLPTYLGGGDCKENDARFHPFAKDIVGEDRNCNGYTLAKQPSPRFIKEGKRKTDLVVLITIDQVRPDHLSVYGYENNTTPELEKVKSEFILFENAYAPGGITTLSLPSMLSNRYLLTTPTRPIFRTTAQRYVNGDSELEAGELLDTAFLSPFRTPWITRFWKEKGYRSVLVFDDYGQKLATRVFDLKGHFDLLHDVKFTGKSGREEVSKIAIESLKDEQLGFLWLHYYDPHAAPFKCERFEKFGKNNCYDDAIFSVDKEIGRVFRALKDAGRWNDSTIVLSSDHGESNGEHSFFHHGLNSHEEAIKVPLMVKLPSSIVKSYPSIWTENVSTLDAISTAFSMMGFRDPDMHGEFLFELGPRSIPILSYRIVLDRLATPVTQNTVMVDGHYRLFYDRVRGVSKSFSLEKDPKQLAPYYDSRLQEKLLKTIDRIEAESTLP